MRKVFFVMISTLWGLNISAQCVINNINRTQAQVITCVNTANSSCSNCNEIEIFGTVNLVGTWNLTTLGDLTITIKTGGSLIFEGNGGGAEQLILTSGSQILIEDTNPANNAILQTGGGGQNRISIGGSNFDGNDFDEIIAAGGANSSGVLPVELTHFAARTKDDMVELDWTTATELNNDFFQIEHSRDGIQFQPVGKVKGEGTTTEIINYNFMHRQPVSGTNYYRLKQVDYDGAFEYSDIVVVEVSSRAGGVQIYPNPTIDKAVIQMNERPERVTFTLTTLLGQRLDLQPGQSDAGWELDLSRLPKGVYILQVDYDGQSLSRKIVKE